MRRNEKRKDARIKEDGESWEREEGKLRKVG